ncbi:DNA starvation/stationary phase protection protein [Pelagibius sp. 7325]|uniref:Dps family protein n=1 Tax=Pelagibius sp. 7325 TaxID=3131994 RepID=UPI0030ED9A81
MTEGQMHRQQHATPVHPASRRPNSTASVASELTTLLADFFVLYIKTKNFHWHASGPHFRDYHRLFDEQATQIFTATDAIAERVRKLGSTTLRSVRHIGLIQRLRDNDTDALRPQDMIKELRDDNRLLRDYMKETHARCDEIGDVATASLLENWIDEAEQRIWFLAEVGAEA